MERLEFVILKNLVFNEDYTRKVLPFLKKQYFEDNIESLIFEEVFNFIETYKKLPTYESLKINFVEKANISQTEMQNVILYLKNINDNKIDQTNNEWLIKQTEEYCKNRAIYLAIMESVHILDSKNTNKSKGEIPKLLSDALAVTFDANVGHDYLNDAEERYDFYHRQESRIPFDIEMLNKITNGGLPNKTLNIFIAGTNVGKSLVMCHMAAACLSQGTDVLYVSMEMAEERIAERIDANLLNVSMEELHRLTKKEYDRKFEFLRAKTQGKLFIKEYPTSSASSLHFRSLLNELQLKKNFVPKIIFVDYLNICSSSRLKHGANVNSFGYNKAIAEELRGLAVEFNVPLVTATQVNRSGMNNSDIEMTDTSESIGIPYSADLMLALISNEELQQLNQLMIKQLKNRFGDPNNNKRFIVGMDKTKMRLFDAEDSAQVDIVDSGQDISPINTFGNRESKFNRNFSGLKV